MDGDDEDADRGRRPWEDDPPRALVRPPAGGGNDALLGVPPLLPRGDF
jgi:hypothetical protein